MIDLFAFEQVIPELLAQFYGDIAKGAFATDKFLEVVVNAIPFLILLPCLCPEVGEEIYLLLVLVQEPEFFIDKRLDTDTADCLCLVQHILIEHSLLLVLGLGIDVNAEEFPATHLHRVRIANGRIIIQIKRYAVVTQWLLSQSYVGACKCHSYIVF